MTGTSVARRGPIAALKGTLTERAPQFTALLPKNYPVERLITGALVAVAQNPELAKCEPATVATALARIAQWGLEVGTTAHLVPYGSKCEPIVDYKGFVELMIAAGARKVEAHEVRDGDDFAYGYGTEPWLRHSPTRGSTKPIIAAYAVVWLPKAARPLFEVLELDAIEARRKKSRGPNAKGPLEPWYARKCAVRAIQKYVPKTVRLTKALEDEAALEGFDPETGETADSLAGRVEIPAETPAPMPKAATAAVEQGDAFEGGN